MTVKPKKDDSMPYSVELAQKICALIADGNYESVSARALGVAPGTFAQWKARKPELKEMVDAATPKAEIRMVNRIIEAADTTWQAAAWYLERKYSQRYGKQDRMPIVDMDTLTDAQLLRIASGENINAVIANPEQEATVQ